MRVIAGNQEMRVHSLMNFLYRAFLALLAFPLLAADNSTLLKAVAFALTGNDTAPIEVVDLSNCIFRINVSDQKNKGVPSPSGRNTECEKQSRYACYCSRA